MRNGSGRLGAVLNDGYEDSDTRWQLNAPWWGASNPEPYALLVTPYELDVRQERGATVVDLSGELDLTNAADVEQHLARVAGDRLVLDLTKVTFLDSAALHMIFRTARRYGTPHPLGICLESSAPIARTLAIVRMDEVAMVRPALDELVPTEQPG
jgi:anti-anti-sigma factor